MKKSFMTRVLAASLSAAMAFSMSSATNLVTASAASTVNLKTTFKTLKVNQTYKLTLKNNTLGWKITKVTTSNKKICTVYGKTSSYVMLKGKGVGRAKISVKVKTTRRKYPKNIKIMTCTANVKAADAAVTFGMTAAATDLSTVKLTFTQPIDAAAAENFAISDEKVKITNVALSEDRKTVTLTTEGASPETEYTVTAKDLKVGGVAQAEQKATYKTMTAALPITSEYKLVVYRGDDDSPYLKSDGASNALIVAEIRDKDGKVVENAEGVVDFSTSRGNLAFPRVTLEKGKAKNTLGSVSSEIEVQAVVIATLVECKNRDWIGLTHQFNVTMTPNPDLYDTGTGAVIRAAESNQADRVIAYFDREVNVEDYLNKDTNKTIDKSKADITIKHGLTSNLAGGDSTTAIGLLPVENDKTAMQILVDEPLRDNAYVKVTFEDKRGNITVKNDVNFVLTDAQKPALMKVTAEGYRTLWVEYSEPVINSEKERNVPLYNADGTARYSIDGIPLSDSDWGDADSGNGATVTPYDYEEGVDNRHKVKITLGRNAAGSRIYLKPGEHSIQVNKIGDWASVTDTANILDTGTLDFTVIEDNTVPDIESVVVQSPEQYLVTFNAPVEANVIAKDVKDADGELQVDNTDLYDLPAKADYPQVRELVLDKSTTRVGKKSVIKLYENGTEISDGEIDDEGKNPIRVTALSEKQYLVEVRRDWTQVYDTAYSLKNYYNYTYSIQIDRDMLENTNNGIKNAAISKQLDGVIKTADVTSVEITDITKEFDSVEKETFYSVKMSEPVKVSDKLNPEGITANQSQIDKIPVPEAQFVKADGSKTIPAVIKNWDITAAKLDGLCQMALRIVPTEALGNGDWNVVVRSISDDVGNTAATLSRPFTETVEEKVSNFRVVWAAVGSNNDVLSDKGGYLDLKKNVDSLAEADGQYIYIKFSEEVSVTGAEGNALSTSNYRLNGGELPKNTNITAGILNYDSKAVKADGTGWRDSVTIRLPDNYTIPRRSTINVVGFIKSRAGERLTGRSELPMPYNFGEYGDEISGITDKKNDIWGDYKSAILSERPDYEGVYPDSNVYTLDSTIANFNARAQGDAKWAKAYLAAVQKALDDDRYRTIKLQANLLMENYNKLTIKRPVNIDLNGYSIDTLNLSFDNSGTIDIFSSNGAATIKKLNVATKNADVRVGSETLQLKNTYSSVNVVSMAVSGVLEKSILLQGKTDEAQTTVGNLAITSAKGTSVELKDASQITTLNIDTTGPVSLIGNEDAGSYVNEVFVSRKTNVSVDMANNTPIERMVLKDKAAGSVITLDSKIDRVYSGGIDPVTVEICYSVSDTDREAEKNKFVGSNIQASTLDAKGKLEKPYIKGAETILKTDLSDAKKTVENNIIVELKEVSVTATGGVFDIVSNTSSGCSVVAVDTRGSKYIALTEDVTSIGAPGVNVDKEDDPWNLKVTELPEDGKTVTQDIDVIYSVYVLESKNTVTITKTYKVTLTNKKSS